MLAGGQIGTVIGMPVSGLLCEWWGWESVFYFFGENSQHCFLNLLITFFHGIFVRHRSETGEFSTRHRLTPAVTDTKFKLSFCL